MVRTDTWEDSALCQEMSMVDPSVAELFFSDDEDTKEDINAKRKEAKSICARCPVRDACLDFALENEMRFGVWGGADEDQLRKALSIDQFGHPTVRIRKIKCPRFGCGSTDIVTRVDARTHTTLMCMKCNLRWDTRIKNPLIPVYDEDYRNKDDLD